MTIILIIIGIALFLVFLLKINIKSDSSEMQSKDDTHFGELNKPIQKISNYDVLTSQIDYKVEEYVEDIVKNIKIGITTTTTGKEITDSSIIDVTGQVYPLEKQTKFVKNPYDVPYWAHHYVYSCSEINYATVEQRAFYNYYKKKVLK